MDAFQDFNNVDLHDHAEIYICGADWVYTTRWLQQEEITVVWDCIDHNE